LLEAEVVTADGAVRVVNAVRDPDLFWALKGGGGGTFGVVSRLTLRTHPLPNYFGEVQATITAASDVAYRALVERVISFYRTSLMNPYWGEQISFEAGRQISIHMVFQGVDRIQAEQTWAPLFDWVTARPTDYTLANPVVLAIPAKDFWNPAVLKLIPGVITTDDRPGAPKGNFFWANNADEVGEVLHAYQSTWLSKQLLAPERRPALVDALVRASQSWQVTLHCNKGLAGAPADALRRTRDTSMNPAVLDAFALAIAAANEPPAYPGVVGHEPHLAQGRRDAKLVAAAMAPLKALAAQPASYVNETDYFQHDWQKAFWGNNYARLIRVKDHYDPTGLFFVHHGVGSEAWTPDGFTKRAKRRV
jgi:FAD/FMN-containing dehydrogenase